MNRHRQRALAAALAALSMPAVIALSAVPPAVAATVLAAEGTTRSSGEAQTAFDGAFCEQNTCRSLGPGPVAASTSAQQIQTGVDATPGDIILVGYSLGATGIYDRLREWERNPELAPDPERVVLIVTYGNPENKFGGNQRNRQGAGLPAEQPYQHLDVVVQYDGVADRPTRFGFYSWINAASSRHFVYFEDDVDINDPGNLIYQEGNTTYMLIPADTLPMLRWVRPFVSAERMAELDARYRPLVERDFDRPDFVEQGEGADWGNGNPPPSVADTGEEALRLAEESESPTRTSVIDNTPSDEVRAASSARSEEESADSNADHDDVAGDDAAEEDDVAGDDAAGDDVAEEDAVEDDAGEETDLQTDVETDTDDSADERDERDEGSDQSDRGSEKSTSTGSNARDSGASSDAA